MPRAVDSAMGYRSESLAMRTHLTALEHELADVRGRAETAETARRDAERRLDRLREGIAEADDLDERGFGRVRSRLIACGALGILMAGAAAVSIVGADFPDASLSWQGVRNLRFLLAHRVDGTELLGAIVLVVAASPWYALPLLGARGLRERRRWGWVVAVAACVLWLVTPAFPLAVAVLVKLLGRDVRAVYFAG